MDWVLVTLVSFSSLSTREGVLPSRTTPSVRCEWDASDTVDVTIFRPVLRSLRVPGLCEMDVRFKDFVFKIKSLKILAQVPRRSSLTGERRVRGVRTWGLSLRGR